MSSLNFSLKAIHDGSCSSFEEEVQENLEKEIFNIVTGHCRKEEDPVEETMFLLGLLEKAEKEQIMLNLSPKPQKAELRRQERHLLNVRRPMHPRS